ncbi:hypothetical protein DPMN_032416 [Dreissena polymorpha]|uniref:Uncharacterized protein n=1 Tax=Dreissena polymorpha TaxID=45954 RepID=A0A9D4RK16_DREPO|nr:hypothetical protein DPMN_032416 [Dreissena polymorpha]
MWSELYPSVAFLTELVLCQIVAGLTQQLMPRMKIVYRPILACPLGSLLIVLIAMTTLKGQM